MVVTVKLFAYFRDNRFVAEEKEIADGTTVGSIIDELKIDRGEVGITIINSKHCSFDTILQAGDVLAIFPVIGGG